MGWEVHTDQLIADGLIHAAIIGKEKADTWATSNDFSVLEGEGNAWVKLWRDPMMSLLYGFVINGTKYKCMVFNEGVLYGNLESDLNEGNKLVSIKTKQAIIIGIFNKSKTPGEAAEIVNKLGELFLKDGF